MQWSSLIERFAHVVTPGHLGLLAIILGGLVLWLLGRKLARPASAISGMVVGGAAALAASQTVGDRGLLLVWMVVGCIIGAVLAWLLFRVWMGLAAAAVLGLALPAAVLVWSGQAIELEIQDPEAAAVEPAAPEPASTQRAEPDEPAEPIEPMIADIQGELRRHYEQNAAWAQGWWDQQPAGLRQTLIYTAAAGAVIGLLGGLAWHYLTATLLSALAGSLMVLLAGKRYIELYATDAPDWVPHNLAVQLTILGLITALGVLVQWTVFRGEADK